MTAVCSEHGIILKRGAQAVESLSATKTIVFDKTGTVTTGRLVLRRWNISAESSVLRDEKMWWKLVHAAESDTLHWASSAIAKKLANMLDEKDDGEVLPRETAIVTPGRGVACKVNGVAVIVGNEEYLRGHAVSSTMMDRHLQSLDESESCALVAFDGQYAGMMAFADEVIPDAKATVARLRAEGFKTIMARQSYLHSVWSSD